MDNDHRGRGFAPATNENQKSAKAQNSKGRHTQRLVHTQQGYQILLLQKGKDHTGIIKLAL